MGAGAFAQNPGVSEQDFLADMPVVLSVSRLAQPLNETPGAVTVLNRETIRMSGARDVADLLRLVPGFQTSMSFEPIAPQASYHGTFGAASNRMQVLVDGRSVYSPYYFGSIGAGLQTVALADIDRIEVLRGSNSAAYGARAFLGVVNIVTRDPLDTVGVSAGITGGDNAIADARASIGGSNDSNSYRISLDRRADGGLLGANDHNRIERVNLRTDIQANPADHVELRAGSLTVDGGIGQGTKTDDPNRDTRYSLGYLQANWHHALVADADIAVSYSHSEEAYKDRFAYSLLPQTGINDFIYLDLSGNNISDTLTFQHTQRASPTVRWVWGAEWRQEQVMSLPLYNTDSALTTTFYRLFGNAEWRLHPNLLLNAGAMAENSSDAGGSFAPRVMLNWQAAPGHTLRVGASRAYRPASVFEQHADVRYSYTGILLAVTNLGKGQVRPESVMSSELGYLGELAPLHLNIDARAFHEQIDGFVQVTDLGPYPGAAIATAHTKSFANGPGFTVDGLEYQVKWQPLPGTQLALAQTFAHNNSPDADIQKSVADMATTFTWFQTLPAGLEFSLIRQVSDPKVLPTTGAADAASISRTDVRLGLPFRTGSHKGNLNLVVQNLGSLYADYAPRAQFQQRTFFNLSLDL
jgi:iron complex outermembrane receptor protein